MSCDYYIFMRAPENYSGEGFEAYCRSFGLKVTVPRQFTLSPEDNLLCMEVEDDRLTTGRDSSVFTLCLDPGAKIRGLKPLRFWDKLFRTKRAILREAMEKTKTVWRICACSVSLMDTLLTFLFAGYLVNACGGIFYLPYEERYFTNSEQIDPVVAEVLAQTMELVEEGVVRV